MTYDAGIRTCMWSIWDQNSHAGEQLAAEKFGCSATTSIKYNVTAFVSIEQSNHC
ncbi:hypothetical protein KSP39_PZI010539 [Platanthera zijinensis]|uniref:Uncharacterized protein n=1 Tax=Platanthera zijinensis TaxID=2320716 RepID=A0AAP0G6T1_9ASPA